MFAHVSKETVTAGNLKIQTLKSRHTPLNKIKSQQVSGHTLTSRVRARHARQGGRDYAPNKHGFPVTSVLLFIIWLRGFSRFYIYIRLANTWPSFCGEGGLRRMCCVLIGCYAERRRLCPGPDWLSREGSFRGGVSGVGSHGSARQGDRAGRRVQRC